MCARLGVMLTASSSGYNSAMLQGWSYNRGTKDVSCPCLSGLQKTEKDKRDRISKYMQGWLPPLWHQDGASHWGPHPSQ